METEQEVEAFIKELTENDRAQKRRNFEIAMAEMRLAEEVLEKTLTSEQHILYNFFCEKREKLCNAGKKLYNN